ncbi:MAG: hypothetical protein J6J21_00200 [Clostridia bacterium]|nr:hypothetical protein [Clostridia bacterium]
MRHGDGDEVKRIHPLARKAERQTTIELRFTPEEKAQPFCLRQREGATEVRKILRAIPVARALDRLVPKMIRQADRGEPVFLRIAQDARGRLKRVNATGRQSGMDVQIVVKNKLHKNRSF